MKVTAKRFKNLTLLSCAAYIFMFALTAKVVFLYMFHHPPKENLLFIEGIVRSVRLGGQSKSTSLLIESERGTFRYSSYYGKVWPGMERIVREDHVQVLAEKKKINKTEIISGKAFYIWELVHQNQVIVAYEDVRDLVRGTEMTVSTYVNGFLMINVVFLAIAYIRKLSFWQKK